MNKLKANKIKEIDRGLSKIAILFFIMLLLLVVIPDSFLGNKEDSLLFPLRTKLMIIIVFLEAILYFLHLRFSNLISRLTEE